jgi:hypothetical protein
VVAWLPAVEREVFGGDAEGSDIVGWVLQRGVLLAFVAVGLASLGCSALLDLDVQYVDAGPDSSLASPDAAGDDHATSGPPDATAAATDAPAHQDNEGSPGTADAPAESSPASPGIQYVQGLATSNVDGANVIVFQLPNVRTGDTLVVAADATSSATIEIADSNNNQFVSASGIPDEGDGVESQIVYAIGVPGGNDTFTVTLDGDASAEFIEVYVEEYSGIGALDGTAAERGSTPTMESGFFTTTVPGDLVFGFAVTGQARGGDGFTARSSYNGNVVEDQIIQTPGSVEATATVVNGTFWAMSMAAFKPR